MADELIDGATIHMALHPFASSSISISVRILQAYRPFTMSPVLRVSLSPPVHSSLPSEAILKLYDRRCLANTRVYFDEGKPWNLEKERKYRAYLDAARRGSVKMGDFASPTYMWDNEVSDGEFEAYLAHVAHNMFTAERDTYERLLSLQGKEIPKLYGVVDREIRIGVGGSGDEGVKEIVPGLLMEYISPQTLRQLVQTWTTREPPLPKEMLATLCNEAVAVVDRVSDLDVLNADVRLDNFLVRDPVVLPSPPSPPHPHQHLELVKHPVVLIDLAQCRFRRTDESEDEWVKAKWSQDETGAVGFVLLGVVRNCVGNDVWDYERSLRYYRPIEDG